jgi:hypothetical protein
MMSKTAKAVAMALTKGGCLGKFKSSDFFFFASFLEEGICRLGTKATPPKMRVFSARRRTIAMA